MPVTVVEAACTGIPGRTATIVLESDDMSALADAAARNQAIAMATTKFGISRAGISGTSGPYPVDEHGDTPKNLLANSPGAPAQRAAKFRQDYTING